MDRENPQLEEAIKALHQQMEDNPTSEKPLDELIKVEEALRSMLEVKELSKETKAEIDRVLMGLTGRTISGFLDEIHERAFRVMKSDSAEAKDDIEGYLAKLKIVYRKVERVILKPDERNGYITGSGKGVEKKELHTNKLQHLLELLRANEIYTDDICIVIGENTPNMMREGSYLYIEIPKVKRSILLHLGYGEASFVLYDIYERAMVFDMTKEEIQEKLGAAKVEYTERDLMKWGLQILEALKLNQVVAQPKINMENYDKRLFYIEEIKKLYPTPEEFLALTRIQKESFKLYGKGLVAVTTILTGDKELRPVGRKHDLAVLAVAVYGKGHKVIEEVIKGDELNNLIGKLCVEEIKRNYPTPEEFMSLSQKQKSSFKFKGKGLKNLSTFITGKPWLDPVGKTKDFAILAEEMYGKGHKIIECENWEKEKWIEELKQLFKTSGKLMALSIEQRQAFRLYGKGLYALATILTGQTDLNPIGKNQDLAKLAMSIYGECNLAVEEVDLEKEKWIEEVKRIYPTPEEFLDLTQIQKESFKLNGKGLVAVATIITGISGLTPTSRRRHMAILAKAVYGEGHKVIEEGLKELAVCNWNREKWIEEIKKIYPTPEKFLDLTGSQKLSFKLYGKGLTYLATIIRDEAGLRPQTRRRDMAILAKAIYGEGHKVIEETLIEAEKDCWDKEKWKEEILNQFPIYVDFMALNYKQKSELKIYGKGLKSLATILTGNSSLDPVNSSTDMSVLARAVYGEEHSVIQKTLREEYAEKWSRERFIDEIKTKYPTPENFMELKSREKKVLKIHGKGLVHLITLITGKPGLTPAQSSRDMAALAEAIYGEGHEVIEKALENDETEEWNREKWIMEIKKQYPTPVEFLELTAKQKRVLKFFGKGLVSIATRITGKTLDPVGYLHDAEILAQAVYGDSEEQEN